MTVSSESNKKIYVGDDSTVNFTFDFLIFANTELEVILTDEDGVETVQTITTHYTVNAGPWPTGGTVTMLTAPATGSPSDELLTIRRKFSYTQLLDYVLSGKFPSATHEQGLDRAVVLIQQMKEIVDRAVLAQTSEDLTSISLEMPNLANRISKFWAWDSLGNLTTAAGTSSNLGPVSAFIDTLLPAVDAAAARAILIAAALESNNLFEAGNTFEYGPNYAAASGTDTYTATLTPTLTVLRIGAIYPIYFANASTVVAPTLQLEALGAKTLKDPEGNALVAGQVSGNHLCQYDGTDMRVLNPAPAVGTWTITIQDSSFSDGEGQTYNSQMGTWAKIGNEVFIKGYLSISSLGTLTGGDTAYLGGLPFPSKGTNEAYGSIDVGHGENLSITAGVNLSGYVEKSVSRIILKKWSSTAGTGNLTINELSGTTVLMFSGHYTAA